MTKMILDGDILRPMNDDELTNFETITTERLEEENLQKQKIELKQNLLIKLGLTQDEAQALLG